MERMLLGALVLLLAVPAGAQERSEKDSTDSPRAVGGLIGGLGSFFGARHAASLNTSALPSGWGCNGRCVGLNRRLMAPPFGGTAGEQMSSGDVLGAEHDASSRSSAMSDDSWNRGDDARTSARSSSPADTRTSDVTQLNDGDEPNASAASTRPSSLRSNESEQGEDGRAPWQPTDYLTTAAGAPSGETPSWTAVSESSVVDNEFASFGSLAVMNDVAVNPAAAVVAPEPSSVALVAAGLVALFAHRRRRSRG